MNETGGIVEVEGTIKFKYAVRSEDCNVFSTEELIKNIGTDGIGMFIDYYLGASHLTLAPGEGEQEGEPAPVVFANDEGERYEIDLVAKLVPGSKYVFLSEDFLADPSPCGDDEYPDTRS